jgi:hypothetical protein
VHHKNLFYHFLPRENPDIHNVKPQTSYEREMYARKTTLIIRLQCRSKLVLFLYMTLRYMCIYSLTKILTNGLIKPFRRIFISYILRQMSQTLGPPVHFLYSQIAYLIPMTECGSAQNLRMFWFNFFVTDLKTEKVCYRWAKRTAGQQSDDNEIRLWIQRWKHMFCLLRHIKGKGKVTPLQARLWPRGG